MSILIFIIVLAVLIFVHEFGHFITAKLAKLRVDEFGFGFPPRMIGKKIGETTYSINWIPFGGFVKIYGEDGDGKSDARSFASRSAWIRIIILIAGVAMNFLLGWLLASFIFFIGARVGVHDENRIAVSDIAVTITSIAADSPAKQADIKLGDMIRRAVFSESTVDVNDVEAFVRLVQEHKGEDMILIVRSGQDERTVRVYARANPPEGEGPLGISLAETGMIRYGALRALVEGGKLSVAMSGAVLGALGDVASNVARTGKAGADVVGPIGLVGITSEAYNLGIRNLIQLVALISLNLAVLNLLPIPALDGGRILFVIIEKVKGSPVSQQLEKWVHAAGFAFLLLLLVVISIKDVKDLF